MSGRDLAAACHRPFSNGTEGRAWMDVWCDRCEHDHAMHSDAPADGSGCQVLLHLILPDELPWPECLLPEPDDGSFALPSRMICQQYKPCTEGTCISDPHAHVREAAVEHTTSYWFGAPAPESHGEDR